ncbi:MAG: signal peptide peptidase SppA [Nitrospirales bacterium]|nr:signal peptide peptidase SppA [Nitrospirales bacterium]
MFNAVSILVGLLLLPGCVYVDLLSGGGPLQEITLSGKGDAKVLLVDISGMLDTQKETGLLEQPSLPARLKEELEIAQEDDQVKGLILRINTPGGTVTASDILYHEILEFKKSKKIPVVTAMMDIATSGGYYVAMASDRIFAHPSTITGSIGVIMVTANAQGLLEKIGVQPTAIVSGPKKGMGSPFQPLKEEERAIFQSVIDTLYGRFLSVVETGRPNLSKEPIRKLADGRIYTADLAKQEGLIDQIGYLDEAIAWVKEEAGLDTAQVVTYRRGRGRGNANVYSSFDPPTIGPIGLPRIDSGSLLRTLSNGTPNVMYLWMP